MPVYYVSYSIHVYVCDSILPLFSHQPHYFLPVGKEHVLGKDSRAPGLVDDGEILLIIRVAVGHFPSGCHPVFRKDFLRFLEKYRGIGI